MAFKATYKLLADMVHDAHYSILAPPIWVLDALDLPTHHNDLTSWNQLATTIGGSEMLWHARRRNLAIQCLCQAADHLSPLSWGKSRWWAGGEDEVAVKVDNESIGRSCEERAALSGHTKDVWAGLLDQFLDVPCVNDWYVETTPLVDSNAEADCLGGNREHSRVVAGEDNAASRRNSCFNDANDVRNREAHEKGPH